MMLCNYSAKPDSTSFTNPLTACSSSAPSAIMRMVVPPTIPRERTPSRLFAFTRRSSFSTQMEDLNSFAFWIKNVAGGRANLPDSEPEHLLQTLLQLSCFFILNSTLLLLNNSLWDNQTVYYYNTATRFVNASRWKFAVFSANFCLLDKQEQSKNHLVCVD